MKVANNSNNYVLGYQHLLKITFLGARSYHLKQNVPFLDMEAIQG